MPISCPSRNVLVTSDHICGAGSYVTRRLMRRRWTVGVASTATLRPIRRAALVPIRTVAPDHTHTHTPLPCPCPFNPTSAPSCARTHSRARDPSQSERRWRCPSPTFVPDSISWAHTRRERRPRRCCVSGSRSSLLVSHDDTRHVSMDHSTQLTPAPS